MGYFSEVILGALFPGKPVAVLTGLSYGVQILEQNLNLISDYKFGFYMKIPEKEMFVAQVYGTLLGPFINYGLMRVIIDFIGTDVLLGRNPSSSWEAVNTMATYSSSMIWGVLGPKTFFGPGSPYRWVYYGFVVGPVAVALTWGIGKWKPHWHMETRGNILLFMYGATYFPNYASSGVFTSALLSLFFMGYMLRYHPVWFRKYNYLVGVGLDCGTEIMQTVMVFCLDLPGASMPAWWGNSAVTDRCYPPASLPPNAV